MAQRPVQILSRLEQAGFEAYMVGGCVRDALLGRPINDWDVTTSALPGQVLALFDRCIPTGIVHGTVTVILADEQAEVTTFRADGAYRDGRHPEGVTFVPTLKEDLARRDFTINAMAMDLAGNLYDHFGGQEDLAAKTLRCVGDPVARFSEDALRMLRAWRFAAQLGFCLEEKTEAAIGVCAEKARLLSQERVRDETEKALLCPRPAFLARMLEAGLLAACGLTARTANLAWLEALPPAPEVRWTAFQLALPDFSPEAFRLPGKLCRHIEQAAAAYQPALDRLSLKKAMAAQGSDAAHTAAILAEQEDLWMDIVASGECVSLARLAVKGLDLSGLSGPQVGRTLHRLLDHVLEHPEDNDKVILLALLD